MYIYIYIYTDRIDCSDVYYIYMYRYNIYIYIIYILPRRMLKKREGFTMYTNQYETRGHDVPSRSQRTPRLVGYNKGFCLDKAFFGKQFYRSLI
jgi:hypothetical protein